MSAFVVPDPHIEALVRFAAANKLTFTYRADPDAPVIGSPLESGRELDPRLPDDARTLADLLRLTNVAAVSERYPNDSPDQLPGTPGESRDSVKLTTGFRPPLPPLAAIKACHCYHYQASELTDYELTFAHYVVETIAKEAIYYIPGYDEAPWVITQ